MSLAETTVEFMFFYLCKLFGIKAIRNYRNIKEFCLKHKADIKENQIEILVKVFFYLVMMFHLC